MKRVNLLGSLSNHLKTISATAVIAEQSVSHLISHREAAVLIVMLLEAEPVVVLLEAVMVTSIVVVIVPVSVSERTLSCCCFIFSAPAVRTTKAVCTGAGGKSLTPLSAPSAP